MLAHVTVIHVLVLGFVFGVVFPALVQRLRPSSGNHSEVGLGAAQ